MRSVYEAQSGNQIEIQRSILQDTAKICSTNFGRHCKIIWPSKTAEHLALAVGCSVRAAAYQLSGEHPPTDKSMLVVINKIFAR